MKCHYITDKEAGKVLIPDCESVAHHYDIDFCTCRDKRKSRIELLENKIEKLIKRIETLENANTTNQPNRKT